MTSSKYARFIDALDLSEDWEIYDIWDIEPKRIDLLVRIAEKRDCACGSNKTLVVHYMCQRSWKHPCLKKHKVYIHTEAPRILHCVDCGNNRPVEIPWAHRDSGFKRWTWFSEQWERFKHCWQKKRLEIIKKCQRRRNARNSKGLLDDIIGGLEFQAHKRENFMENQHKRWKRHVTRFARIKLGNKGYTQGYEGHRIEFLQRYLDILDRKFSTLLQFQGLLGLVAGVVYSALINKGRPQLNWVIEGLFGIFTLFWFLNVFLCLQGVGRLAWGDMWRTYSPQAAEDKQVNEFIKLTIKRSAQFRLAVLLAFINGAPLLIIIFIAIPFSYLL